MAEGASPSPTTVGIWVLPLTSHVPSSKFPDLFEPQFLSGAKWGWGLHLCQSQEGWVEAEVAQGRSCAVGASHRGVLCALKGSTPCPLSCLVMGTSG